MPKLDEVNDERDDLLARIDNLLLEDIELSEWEIEFLESLKIILEKRKELINGQLSKLEEIERSFEEGRDRYGIF